MWIILFNALDDFGVREINEAARIGSPPGHMLPTNYMQIEEMKRKVLDEALHGALRIAGLVSRDARASSARTHLRGLLMLTGDAITGRRADEERILGERSV